MLCIEIVNLKKFCMSLDSFEKIGQPKLYFRADERAQMCARTQRDHRSDPTFKLLSREVTMPYKLT